MYFDMFFTRISKIYETSNRAIHITLRDSTLISHFDVESHYMDDVGIEIKTKNAKYRYDVNDVATVRVSIEYDYSNK